MMKAPRHPIAIKKGDLAELLREIQFMLFYMSDDMGNDSWTLEKEINSTAVINDMMELFDIHGLSPTEIRGPKDWRPKK